MKPLLFKHFKLKSYVEKYPLKALKSTFSRHLLTIPINQLDYLFNLNKKFEKRKIQPLFPGSKINSIRSSAKMIVFYDEFNKIYVVDIVTFKKFKKLTKKNAKFTISNVENFQLTGTCIWQDSTTKSIKYIEASDNDSSKWSIQIFAEDPEIKIWASNFNKLVFLKNVIPEDEEKAVPTIHFCEDINNPEWQENIKKVQIKDFEISKIEISKTQIILITEDNEMYQTSLPFLNFTRTHVKLGNCNFMKTNGISCNIGVYDCSIPRVNEWDTEKMISFFQEIGLDDFAKSVKYTKLDGETLLEYDPEDLENNLGIRDAKDQNHLMLYTNLHRKVRYKDPVVYGWGNNKNMELGINTGSFNVQVPNKLDIVLNDQDDFVDDLELGNGPSIIKTLKKQFFVAWDTR